MVIVFQNSSVLQQRGTKQIPSAFEDDEELAVLEAPELAIELNAPSVFVGEFLAFCHWLLS